MFKQPKCLKCGKACYEEGTIGASWIRCPACGWKDTNVSRKPSPKTSKPTKGKDSG